MGLNCQLDKAVSASSNEERVVSKEAKKDELSQSKERGVGWERDHWIS